MSPGRLIISGIYSIYFISFAFIKIVFALFLFVPSYDLPRK